MQHTPPPSPASGAPLAADELPAISAEPAILHADPADVAAEFWALCEQGFLCPVPGFGNRYCRITEKGLRNTRRTPSSGACSENAGGGLKIRRLCV